MHIASKTCGELAVVMTFALKVLQDDSQISRVRIEPYERFVFAAPGWMIAAFAFDSWIFAASATVSGYQGWVHFISLYDAPWRDLQLASFRRWHDIRGEPAIPSVHLRLSAKMPARALRAWCLYLWNKKSPATWWPIPSSCADRAGQHGPSVLELCRKDVASIGVLIRGFGLFSVKVEHDRCRCHS